jgi:hypothetical protein
MDVTLIRISTGSSRKFPKAPYLSTTPKLCTLDKRIRPGIGDSLFLLSNDYAKVVLLRHNVTRGKSAVYLGAIVATSLRRRCTVSSESC